MKIIAENLTTAMVESTPETKLGIIVTTNGPQPEGFGLKSFDGLNGLYYGQLTHDRIRDLAQDPNVKSVELDRDNTVL